MGSKGRQVFCPPIARIQTEYIFCTIWVDQHRCLPAGGAFFSLCAQRKESKERAAKPLRRPRSPRSGTGGAKTRLKLKQFAPSSDPGPRRPAHRQWRHPSPNTSFPIKKVPGGASIFLPRSCPRSHALRGNAPLDAPRHHRTRC